jgi:hypothetical protein
VPVITRPFIGSTPLPAGLMDKRRSTIELLLERRKANAAAVAVTLAKLNIDHTAK